MPTVDRLSVSTLAATLRLALLMASKLNSQNGSNLFRKVLPGSTCPGANLSMAIALMLFGLIRSTNRRQQWEQTVNKSN